MKFEQWWEQNHKNYEDNDYHTIMQIAHDAYDHAWAEAYQSGYTDGYDNAIVAIDVEANDAWGAGYKDGYDDGRIDGERYEREEK